LQLPEASHPSRTGIARFLALVVTLLGAATLTEYVFGLNLGIDQLFVKDPQISYGTTAPGLMAPTSAVAFMALGLALLLLNWKSRRGPPAITGIESLLRADRDDRSEWLHLPRRGAH